MDATLEQWELVRRIESSQVAQKSSCSIGRVFPCHFPQRDCCGQSDAGTQIPLCSLAYWSALVSSS